MSERVCANCGRDVAGRYCGQCGQPWSSTPLQPLRAWLGETLDEVFLVEARLPRSVLALLWPPGRLTAEWWSGRRAAYVSPLRLYLLAAVPFFLVFSARSSEVEWGQEDFFEIVLVGAYETATGLAGYEPLPPLPPELAADSASREAWQREFQARREEYRLRFDRQNEQIIAGLRRTVDMLPVLVGVLMIPLLAVLLRATGASRESFVAATVFSLHLHTIGYVASGIGWLLGAPFVLGMLLTTAYFVGAQRTLETGTSFRAFVRGGTIAFGYVLLFAVVYIGFVVAVTNWAPGLLFPG